MTWSGRSLWTWTLSARRVAGDEHRLADRLEVVADGVDVERLAGPSAGAGTSSRSRSPRRRGRRASTASAPAAARRRARRRAGASPTRWSSAPWNSRYRPWPPESTTPASRRIGSRRRRPRDRLLGGLDGRGQDGLDVVVALGGGDGGGGRLADDRQDRALDRLGDRPVGGLGALRQRVGEVEAVEPASCRPRPSAMPAEDLAGDDARVAAGAHQRPEADRGGDRARPAGRRRPRPPRAPPGPSRACSSRCRRRGPG